MTSTAPDLSQRGPLTELPYSTRRPGQPVRVTSTVREMYGFPPLPPRAYSPRGIFVPRQDSVQSASPYTPLEFPAKASVQVRSHVKYMEDQPYAEKTFRYKVGRARDVGRELVIGARQKAIKLGKLILVPIYEVWKGLWGSSMKVLRVVIEAFREIITAVAAAGSVSSPIRVD